MKKTRLIILSAICGVLLASCNKIDYNSFVGTWGVEKIEYYNIDYAGNPIPATMETYTYDPNSTDNGIQLIFRADKTGEMRDSAIDTIVQYNEETEQNEYIICPDTVLVTRFTCSFDERENYLYMTLETNPRPYGMSIEEMTKTSFIYKNEYLSDYVEKAYMKRVDGKSSDSKSRNAVKHPHHKPGSLFGNR